MLGCRVTMSEGPTRVLPGETATTSLMLPGVRLTVVEGADRGREVVVRRGAVRVGTASDNDLVIADAAVSRRHLEIRLRSDGVRVADLGSTNGTRIDGVQVIEAVVAPASLVRLGSTAIRVTTVDEPVIVPLSTRERFGGLLGRSPAMREAFALLERVSPTDATVLLEAETGCGKEVAAEAIHAHSPRADSPFVAVDCGAVAASLIESEFFGHVRGAFTGAIADRRGAFEEADGGTLFLDEIGELPLDLQPKLLRALENRTIRRVGATQSRPIDVRVIAATNRDLAAEVNRGGFREDLFFRLAVVRIRLPPLRARPDDIPVLVRHFLHRLKPDSPDPSPDLLRALSARPWPGNVRELRNAVERAVAMAEPARQRTATGSLDPGGAGGLTMSALFELPIQEAVDRWVEQLERAYVEDVLRRSGGSVSGAARLAGTNRRYIQRLMKRHGLREDPTAAARDED